MSSLPGRDRRGAPPCRRLDEAALGQHEPAQPAGVELDREGPARHGAGDLAVQLPVPAADRAADRRTRRREHRRPQAVRAGRAPVGVGQEVPGAAHGELRRRRDRRRRRAEHRPPEARVRPHLLHWRRVRRQDHPPSGGRVPHAVHPRARWKVAVHGAGRRQPADRGQAHRVGQADERR